MREFQRLVQSPEPSSTVPPKKFAKTGQFHIPSKVQLYHTTFFTNLTLPPPMINVINSLINLYRAHLRLYTGKNNIKRHFLQKLNLLPGTSSYQITHKHIP